MPTTNFSSVPFNEAIEHFRGKLNIPAKHWDDMLGEVNAKGFTVAGATKADLLGDLFNDVEKALSSGGNITAFRKSFDKTVAKHGWTYKGKRGWRTRVIYDTNLRTSHMAGKWQQFQRAKTNRPFLQYLTVGDQRVRPDHQSWNSTVLPVDDSWWSSHFPPNGWGCRCTVRSLSQSQLDREGLTPLNEAPPIKKTERINAASGEVYGHVPKGIDVGWDYNVGKAWLGPDIAFGEKIMAMPTAVRNSALDSAKDLVPHLEKAFSPWANKLLTRKKALGEIKTVGYLSPKIVDELIRRNHAPTTAVITTTDRDIMHMLRDAKDGKHLPVDMIRSLPEFIHKPTAILWDKRKPGLLYIFDMVGDDRAGKIVLRVNYKLKARGADNERHSLQTNSLITSGLVKLENLKDKNVYDVLEGGL